jgi:ketosteroid isomerase-like protein
MRDAGRPADRERQDPKGDGTMSEQQNLDIVRRGYEAFGRGDIDALLALFDQQIEWRTPGPAEVPTAGTRRGLQQVGQFFAAVVQTFDIQRFEPRTFIADGDRVVVLGSETARVRATGTPLELSWAHAFTLRDGKVTDFEEYFDTSAVVAELRSAQAAT